MMILVWALIAYFTIKGAACLFFILDGQTVHSTEAEHAVGAVISTIFICAIAAVFLL